MYYTETYKIKKDLEKEKFLRKSLVNLSLCGVKDIYKSKFAGVEETNCKYTIFYYSILVEYTCSIGYKKPYLREHFSDEDYDWKPFQGTAKEDCTLILKDLNIVHNVSTDLKKALNELIEKSTPIENEIVDEEIVKFINSVQLSSYDLGRNIPGDKHKDVRVISSSGSIDKCFCFDAPFYELEGEYKGEKFWVSNFATELDKYSSQFKMIEENVPTKVEIDYDEIIAQEDEENE